MDSIYQMLYHFPWLSRFRLFERIMDQFKELCLWFSENGLIMYMWLGMQVNPEWVHNVFGVQSAAQIDIDQVSGGIYSIGKHLGLIWQKEINSD